ncbi:phage portal protein [Paracoccus sp. KR1-242]|uniref:phage portal protein n=1 Tax=Paracoccus sp. KR1-242 TaxID=3410028 RepID=UPI003BFE1AA0
MAKTDKSAKARLLASASSSLKPHAAAPDKLPGSAAKAYTTGYMRGGRSVAMNAWHPGLREAQDDVAAAWDKAAARANDAIINSGWLSGALEQCVANVVGTGLRLKAQPENELFGMSNADARAWCKLVEQRFGLWANRPEECDAEGKRTFGQLQAAAFRGWMASGEILSEVGWKERGWTRYGTKVRVMPAHRLCRDSDDMQRLHTGVYVDDDGAPIAYLTQKRSPIMGWAKKRIAARDAYGRLLLGHFHDGPLGSHRGIGPLVAVLQVVRQFDDLSDATLAAQILKTLWAAVIESPAPTEEFLTGFLTDKERALMQVNGEAPIDAYFDMLSGFYDASPISVGQNGRVGHLMPGDKFELKTPGAPSGEYQDYANDLKREIARALGMTFESFTGDYQGASYNSMSYGTTEIFEVTKKRRTDLVAPFCQMGYEAWLEEEIDRGDIPFPGGIDAFVANRAAASRAFWRGSPRPIPDILKAAKAYEILERTGVASQGMIADAMFGSDIEDVYAQREQEAELRKEYGLPEPSYMNAAGGGTGANPIGNDDPDDEQEDDA